MEICCFGRVHTSPYCYFSYEEVFHHQAQALCCGLSQPSELMCEWTQSHAIKPSLVLCKWASSTSAVHHISLHNPIWGVWAVAKWLVALLITLAALLHLQPAFIKWATCSSLDVIKARPWEYITMFSGNSDTYSTMMMVFFIYFFIFLWC